MKNGDNHMYFTDSKDTECPTVLGPGDTAEIKRDKNSCLLEVNIYREEKKQRQQRV